MSALAGMAPSRARLPRQVTDALMHAVGAIAALLVVLETGVLFAGVVARYVFASPILWVDEIAGAMFVWLGMLGAVLALQRDEHMRLSVFVARLSPQTRAWIETFSAMVVALFVALILMPGISHAREQMDIGSPALNLPDGYRAAALPVGSALMLLVSIVRIAGAASVKRTLGVAAALLVTGLAMWWAQPWFASIGNGALLVFFGGLIAVCMVAGVPIAFVFGIATASYLCFATQMPLSIVVSRIDEGMSGMILLSIPLFVLLGALLQISGLARAMVDCIAALIGHRRGGMENVLLGSMFLVSGISGSKAADMAAVAPAILPEMERRGANTDELVALLAASGAMTETIPPSLVLITIGAVCNISIAALFDAGLLPAIVATLAIGAVCIFKAFRSDAVRRPKADRATILRTTLVALPALALPVMIRFAVVDGIATATEVSTIGIVYTLIAALIVHLRTRHLSWRIAYRMLIDVASLSGAILLVIGVATSMAWALTQSGFSTQLVAFMLKISGGATGFLLISMLLFVVLGSLLEGIPAVVLFGPLLFPIARSLAIADVHYAMVMILGMGLGLFAPPFGVGFYSACAIARVAPDRVVKHVVPYLGALAVVLLVIALAPWISTAFVP